VGIGSWRRGARGDEPRGPSEEPTEPRRAGGGSGTVLSPVRFLRTRGWPPQRYRADGSCRGNPGASTAATCGATPTGAGTAHHQSIGSWTYVEQMRGIGYRSYLPWPESPYRGRDWRADTRPGPRIGDARWSRVRFSIVRGGGGDAVGVGGRDGAGGPVDCGPAGLCHRPGWGRRPRSLRQSAAGPPYAD